MPLHADDVGAGQFDRLNDAVARVTGRDESVPESVNALVVVAVDHHRPAEQASEAAAVTEFDCMTAVPGGIAEETMGRAGSDRQVPDKRAAECDVDQLGAAADAQHRAPEPNGGANQLDLEAVEHRIEHGRPGPGHATVKPWIDVFATREHEPLEGFHQLTGLHLPAEPHRQTARLRYAFSVRGDEHVAAQVTERLGEVVAHARLSASDADHGTRHRCYTRTNEVRVKRHACHSFRVAVPSTPRRAPAATPAIRGNLGRSMSGDLAQILRSQIHGGLLGPGDRLPNERDLAASLGVGRITVREAIRILVEDGYVVSKRGNSGGTYVSDLERAHRTWIERVRKNPQWVVDLIEYRKAIEMRAAELAAERHSAAQLTEMRRAVEEGSQPSSRSAFRQADHRFHVAIAEASGSRRLTAAIAEARGELFVPTDQLVFQDHYLQTRNEHTEILSAIKVGDANAARQAAEQHLQGSLQDFLDMVI